MSRQNLAQEVKRERQQRSWSQLQLAEASGLSLRTIQRLETTGHCSHETLLSVAAAFDVDIKCFTVSTALALPETSKPEGKGQPAQSRSILIFRSLRKILSPRRIASISLAAIFPALYFVSSVILRDEFGIDWLNWLYLPMDILMANPLFNAATPVIFLGGLLFALVLSGLAIVDVEIDKTEETLSSRFTVSLVPRNTALILTSLTLLGVIVGYGSKYVIRDVVEVVLSHLP